MHVNTLIGLSQGEESQSYVPPEVAKVNLRVADGRSDCLCAPSRFQHAAHKECVLSSQRDDGEDRDERGH